MRTVRTSVRFVRMLLVAFALLYLFITFTPVVKMIVLTMDQDWYDGNGDVLVVLGGDMLVPGDGPYATLGHDTYLRCAYASWILRQRTFKYVVVTGRGEAVAMARYLEQNGRAADTILLENHADSTYENALFTKQLLERQYGGGVPPVVVLTSDYHSWRAHRVFTHAGFETHMIPVPDVIKQSAFFSRRWPAFITLLTEIAKDCFYFVRGRI